MPRSYDALTAEGALAEQLGTLTGSREQGFNAAEEALHRHPGERPALVWRAGESRRVLSYGELSDRTARMAAILHAHGVGPGAPVAVLLPKRPALLETLFAAWHLGAVVVPLFGSQSETYKQLLTPCPPCTPRCRLPSGNACS